METAVTSARRIELLASDLGRPNNLGIAHRTCMHENRRASARAPAVPGGGGGFWGYPGVPPHGYGKGPGYAGHQSKEVLEGCSASNAAQEAGVADAVVAGSSIRTAADKRPPATLRKMRAARAASSNWRGGGLANGAVGRSSSMRAAISPSHKARAYGERAVQPPPPRPTSRQLVSDKSNIGRISPGTQQRYESYHTTGLLWGGRLITVLVHHLEKG
jgi:hypothetical protein